MKVFTKAISIMTAALLMLTGCGSIQAPNGDDSAGEDESLEIGLCFDSFVNKKSQSKRELSLKNSAKVSVGKMTAKFLVTMQIFWLTGR